MSGESNTSTDTDFDLELFDDDGELPKHCLQNLEEYFEKHQPRPKPTFHTAPVTDKSVVLVKKRTADPKFHAYSEGEPACGWNPGADYERRDITVANVWNSPCKRCYQDAEGGKEPADVVDEIIADLEDEADDDYDLLEGQ